MIPIIRYWQFRFGLWRAGWMLGRAKSLGDVRKALALCGWPLDDYTDAELREAVVGAGTVLCDAGMTVDDAARALSSVFIIAREMEA